MLTDIMVGVASAEAYISKITLALMEDSGWYHVDYDNTQIKSEIGNI